MLFKRFAGEARSCVEAAVEGAADLGHDKVGDEDLLLGVLVGGGSAAEVLGSFGVTAEAVREELEELHSEALASVGISYEDIKDRAGEAFTPATTVGRITFSPRAKKVLGRALREAVGLGDARITAEHLLLGILADKDGTAVRALSRLGAPAEEVEEKVREARLEG